MSLKLKLFSLANSNVSPNFIGPFECIKAIHAKLRPLLEGNHIVNWPFQVFDIESRRKIKCKLKGFNRVSSDVYVMPLVEPNLESTKRMCVVDLNFIF